MNPNRLKFRRTASSVEPEEATLVAVAINPDLAAMSWGDLRKLAIDRGLYRVGMKRAEVEEALSQ